MHRYKTMTKWLAAVLVLAVLFSLVLMEADLPRKRKE